MNLEKVIKWREGGKTKRCSFHLSVSAGFGFSQGSLPQIHLVPMLTSAPKSDGPKTELSQILCYGVKCCIDKSLSDQKRILNNFKPLCIYSLPQWQKKYSCFLWGGKPKPSKAMVKPKTRFQKRVDCVHTEIMWTISNQLLIKLVNDWNNI